MMGSDWNHVLGQSHAANAGAQLEADFTQFVPIPAQQYLGNDEAEALANPILETETRAGIDNLKRYKSGDTRGFNHDFYKAFKDALVPGLTKLFNTVLNGDGIPQTFLEAVIVPLRKKDHSSDAMDYRPISLLNTAHKICWQIISRTSTSVPPKTHQ
ncbi:hypothetical protein PC110_g19223 [Phytophthora cactorum]|uniref:Reverse transcriptase domain-containing protein n=1 Tax=Phytophthora cactorum TaxID=29920 RepID=A0A329RIV3_9STRA|nr:hypothetical protein PC110_g19223 [Phytophthora cactorum]